MEEENGEENGMGFPETFKALSDPVPQRDSHAAAWRQNVSRADLQPFSMTNATISYHLAQLKRAELVRETREKNFVYYELNMSVFEELMMWFSQFTGAEGTQDDKEKN